MLIYMNELLNKPITGGESHHFPVYNYCKHGLQQQQQPGATSHSSVNKAAESSQELRAAQA
jgi:hypothetical protein